MSVQNPERLATKQDLKDMYDRIRPYMGGLVTSKAGFTPIGTIISVMGTTAPVNYLACDGTVYNIADYTELANYFNEQFGSINFFGGNGTTTFAVPDLRGEFLRGTGTNSHENQGSGASVGVHQDATIFPHFITQNNKGYYRLTGTLNPDKTLAKTASTYVFNAVNVESAETINNCNTSRPTNTSVLYCIATKNFYIDPTLDYSTEEKIVGTWIDSKPIYQRTWTGTITSNVSGFMELIPNFKTITNFETIVRLDGTLENETNSWQHDYYSTEVDSFRVLYRQNQLQVYIGSYYPSKPINWYVTCQYTKTT